MSRQPTQRSLFEGLRTSSEVMRTSEITASDVLNTRNAQALAAAAQAREDALAAQGAADAAVAAAAAAVASTGAATDAITAATDGTAAANAAVTSANARMAHLAHTAVQTVTTLGDLEPPGGGTFTNDLGLVLSGSWGGLVSIVRVALPVSGRGGGAASPLSRRLNFELRLNGVAVCNRWMSTDQVKLMTFTYANPNPLPAGTSTYELWMAGGGDGFVDAGSIGGTANEVRRTMTVTVVGA